MKNVLITGINGFIGKNLYKKINENYNVYGISRSNKSFIVNDLINLNFENLPNNIDSIIHLAQSINYSENNLEDLLRVNIISIKKLLNYGLKNKIKYFLNFSSGSVYEPYSGNLVESDQIICDSPYAISKQISEQLTNSYSKNFKTCNMRIFFPYGKNQINRLFPRIYKKILNNEMIEISENGSSSKLSPIFIEDLVDITEKFLKNKWQGTYNIASPHTYTIKDIAKIIAKHLNKDVKFTKKEGMKSLNMVPSLKKLKKKISSNKFKKIEDVINTIF